MAKVTVRYFTDEEWQNQYAPGLNTASREVRERQRREEEAWWQQKFREEAKQRQEILPILDEANKKAMEADRERWEREKPKVEAEAARTARMLFARNMKKLQARLHDAADGDIKPD